MKAKICSVLNVRANSGDDEFIVRPVPEEEAEEQPQDGSDVRVVVPRRNVFDVFNPDLFVNQFEEVV